MTYNFAAQREAWAKPPIGGRSVASGALKGWSDEAIRMWTHQTWPRQYGQPSNFDGGYLKHLGIETTLDKTVMDFGCGFGFDSLGYARGGCKVVLADIRLDNLATARRVLMAHDFMPLESRLVTDQHPFFDDPPEVLDVFHCSGVLHHIPYASDILRRASEVLAPDGEIRLMLYTDHLFRTMTKQEPGGIDDDVSQHPAFERYVRGCDAVGYYADWYTPEKLLKRCAGLFDLAEWHYLRPDRGNAVAILRRA